ncbi:MAG TPA: efflux RND transporter permease subunit, partial [Chthonomonadales bacterium]|nr:efflux RND transporter permease subunit [Chthonomonadales bacterium]
MWFTRLAIARPLLVWMALATAAVLGIRGYFQLPAELNPRVDIPTITITTVYPGAGPREIESQVTKPLSTSVGAVPGIKDIYSSSQDGVSIISIDFRVGTNLDAAADQLRAQ